MTDAMRDLIASKKFWTAILGVVTLVAARVGFHVDDQLFWSIAGVFSMLLGAQGLTDHGKAKAEAEIEATAAAASKTDVPVQTVPPKASTSGATPGAATMLAIFMLATIGVTFAAGACTHGTRAVARDGVVDCGTAAAKDAIAQFAPAVGQLLADATGGDGHVDWGALEKTAATLAVDTGGCVLATLVAHELSPDTTARPAHGLPAKPIDASSLREAFEQVRRKRFGGRRFATEAGTL